MTDRTAGPGPRWPRVLFVVLALWVLSTVVTFLTGKVNLLPTTILLGSFLAPVTFVVWAYEKADLEPDPGPNPHHEDNPDRTRIGLLARAFLLGAGLGVLGAASAQAYLESPSPLLLVSVAVVEEVLKLCALMCVARGLGHRTARDGMLLGATVGFGFAALESAGYAMTSMLAVPGMSLRELVETEVLRGVLTPIGHGLWTAILGGVLFATVRDGRWRLDRSVLAGVVGVSTLHALWDAASPTAVYVTAILTDAPWRETLLTQGYLPRPSDLQVHLYTAVDWLGLLLIASIGLFWLGSMRRRIEVAERQRARAEQVRRELQDLP